MASQMWVDIVKRKLTDSGVRKLVPDSVTLEAAYSRAARIALVQDAVDQAMRQANDSSISIPRNLKASVERILADNTMPGDEAIARLARDANRR